MKTKLRLTGYICMLILLPVISACLPQIEQLKPEKTIPESYPNTQKGDAQKEGDNTEVATAEINWQEYFGDTQLVSLLEVALEKNQELQIALQEIEITKNEIGARQGAYLPSIELAAEAAIDKVGEFTREGVIESNHEIEPGKSFPDPLPDYFLGAHTHWEVDIWKKLRNAERSAVMEFLATTEGRNFMVTNLIAEVANSYFELLALDNQLEIVQQNIKIQSHALKVVQLKKEGARVTELAVRRFKAQLLNTRSLQAEIQQKITETENKINFLLGRYPQTIARSTLTFPELVPKYTKSGIPSELFSNRPDIKQAEMQLEAANLNIEVARANFYPALHLSGSIGYSAYKTSKLLSTPESLAYAIGGGLLAPFINRREIEALYLNASAMQKQAITNYERTVLRAFIEVANQLANIRNLERSYSLKTEQVQALADSVEISGTLFNAARADYMEVLLTQREALEARFELVETKRQQLQASVNIYRALGGGWKSKVEDKSNEKKEGSTS